MPVYAPVAARAFPVALILALAAAPLPAFAQGAVPKDGATSAPDCNEAQTQVEMNYCAEQDWMAADVELNAVYAEARDWLKSFDADLPEDRRSGPEALRDAQRAWIAYRDLACTAQAWPMRGGSAEPLLIYGCRRDLTEKRVAELRDLLAYGD